MIDRENQLRSLLPLLAIAFTSVSLTRAETLPQTETLQWEGDIAMRLVDSVDAFLLRELDRSIQRRENHWNRDLTSWHAYTASIEQQRKRLAHIVGVRDQRVPFESPERLATVSADSLVGRGPGYTIHAIRWPAFGGVHGEGLLLQPTVRPFVADIIAFPDCEVLPEQLAGLTKGVAPESQYARRLAEAGCRVVVPLLINRERGQFDWGVRPPPNITNREMLYRSAFELGRTLVGYEIQKAMSIVDWYEASGGGRLIGVIGWGEGGLLSLYCGALDERIDSVCVSGYFSSRQNVWDEPLDRNIFGLLEQFGDAELASLIVPRSLVIEAAAGPSASIPGHGGGPARLVSPQRQDVEAEVTRIRQLLEPLDLTQMVRTVASGNGTGPHGTDEAIRGLLHGSGRAFVLPHDPNQPEYTGKQLAPAGRHRAQMMELDRHNQELLRESQNVRAKFMQNLDTSSEAAYVASAETYRKNFYEEVIGRFDYSLVSPNPRSRRIYETDHWRGYEVVLDVFENVFAYGILILPKDLKEGEQRPVVVCQHGLEGRPQDTVGLQGSRAYAGFAGKLAERGYITFAPQNLYIGRDRFRTLQRKSYALKKTLFSTITPQHQQIVNWLKTLPHADPDRIAFYGLSYGGKTAMRVPPLVKDYCLSICSADFNEWVDKNASTRNPRSYVWTGEYEIFEFDLGSTFNYAEMAALIAPRPFMVERGHSDGVADDWTVAWEFAKVRHLYAARLKMPDRCEIEWFDGPHTINGRGTFAFLDRHLNWNTKND